MQSLVRLTTATPRAISDGLEPCFAASLSDDLYTTCTDPRDQIFALADIEKGEVGAAIYHTLYTLTGDTHTTAHG